MNMAILSHIVSEFKNDRFAYVSAADAQPLIEAGYIEVNSSMLNPNNPAEAATRPTSAGIAAVEAQQSSGFTSAPAASGFVAASQTSAATKQTFSFVSGFQPPAKKPRGAKPGVAEEKYPFGELQAPTQRADGSLDYTGAVVFIPSNTHTKGEKKGQLRTGEEMAFSLVSACSAANRRYATVVGEEMTRAGKLRKKYELTRDFKSAPGEQNGVVGAYIYRAK